MSTTDNLLEIRQLEVAYGGIRAVRGIDLRVERGELVSLIGANGAGKSTTLRAICGLVPVAGCGMLYEGISITGAPSYIDRKSLLAGKKVSGRSRRGGGRSQ